MNQEIDFEPLTRLVRERISLTKNKRLREALAERGDPQVRLDKELPAAVAIEWNEEHPEKQPPASKEEVSEEDLRSIRRRVVRRLEKQGDEGEDKIIRAARRMPALGIDEDAQYKAAETLRGIAKAAGLTPRELDIYQLTLDGFEDNGEIAEILGLERESVAKTRYRMMKKLRESAANNGYSGKVEKNF